MSQTEGVTNDRRERGGNPLRGYDSCHLRCVFKSPKPRAMIIKACLFLMLFGDLNWQDSLGFEGPKIPNILGWLHADFLLLFILHFYSQIQHSSRNHSYEFVLPGFKKVNSSHCGLFFVSYWPQSTLFFFRKYSFHRIYFHLHI